MHTSTHVQKYLYQKFTANTYDNIDRCTQQNNKINA